MKRIALVRARGGSVGVPRKNMRMLAGRPLIQWTLDTAKASEFFEPDKIIVSSDDPEILDFARAQGVNPVRRPDSLSDGFARIEDVLDHVLSSAQIEMPDQIVILNPTSPFRSVDDIQQLCLKVASSPKYTGGLTVVEDYGIQMRNLSVGRRGPDGYWKKINPRESDKRQDRKPRIVQAGSVYVINGKFYSETRQWLGIRNCIRTVPQERALDIDTPWDFLCAEAWAAELERRKGKSWI